MKVLVINCGSSSLKYQLIDMENESVIAKGLCERIGIDGRLVYQKAGLDKETTELPMPTHKEAVSAVLSALVNDKTGALASLDEIEGVGHRILHGGSEFTEPVILNEKVIVAFIRDVLASGGGFRFHRHDCRGCWHFRVQDDAYWCRAF